MNDVLIVGGGAAGMAAAVFAAEAGCPVQVFEQNEKLGKKLFITGKGRCNFTNACDTEELFSHIVTNPKFLYSAFYGFDSRQAVEFFERLGVRTKVERGGRAFPASDHSSDILRALERRMRELGVRIHLHTRVKALREKDGGITGILTEDGRVVEGGSVIIATGGMSYSSTGSTGDGYRFAEAVGHTVTELRPGLVPLVTAEEYIPRLQGLSLKNVALQVKNGKKACYKGFGEMLFTHYGISGPLALTASSFAGKYLKEGFLKGEIDLKPALAPDQLDARLLREFEASRNRLFRNAVAPLFPARLLPVMLELGGIPGDRPVHEITREERERFAEKIKHFPFTVTGTRGWNEAIITQGGVSVREVSPSTMESRKKKHLYFIGEVLDLDGVTGGFNLQIAWATARAAAEAAAGKE
jgi:predicted Rossmann fold flavoprotein